MKRILIVDDTKSIRTLLATCLELDGFSVETAENGKAALALVTKEAYDLVFLDIKLPVMSGTEVLRKIREKGIQVPVAVITAFGNIKNAVDCTKMGAVAYIQKPFTANRINALLDELNIKSTENSAKADMALAKDLIVANRLEEAEKMLRSFLSGNPLDAEVYRMLSETSMKAGRPEEAEKYLKLYRSIQ